MNSNIIVSEKFKANIAKQFREVKKFVKKSKAKNITELFEEMKANNFYVYFGLDDDFFYAEYKDITADIFVNKAGEITVSKDIQVFNDNGERVEWHYYIK